MKNWSYTIKEGEHKGVTLWSGRYCAVAAFVFCKLKGEWCVLANQRGRGTPDYQGYWNCVCGYLEADENAEEGCAREVYEETGVKIKPSKFTLASVQTEPSRCEHGNVTLRYFAILKERLDDVSVSKSAVLAGNGEKDEVEAIGWIPLKDVDNYDWAFNHKQILKEIFKSRVRLLNGEQ